MIDEKEKDCVFVLFVSLGFFDSLLEEVLLFFFFGFILNIGFS